MSKRKRYIESCQVSGIKMYVLGGYSQKVVFDGKDRSAPIIIFLHGGPGSPVPFCAGCRGLFPEISDKFIMVYWDQLGCGMNDCIIDDSFSIEDYITMTVELIEAVHRDFPENKINLFGVSWGSVLAANAAYKIPDIINRVAVYGQVTKDLFFNQEVFDTLDNARLSKKEKDELTKLKTIGSPEQHDIMMMARLIRKHTEGYQSRKGGKTPMGDIIFGLLTSPDYTMKDFKAVGVNGTRKNQSLFSELLCLDLRDTLKNIKVPYMIMQGDTDIVASTRFIKAFVEKSENDALIFRLVKNSGHIPGGEGMEYIIEKGLGFLSGQDSE